jgi:ribonuclease R
LKAKEKSWEQRDPQHAQEARKYAHPIPSRAYILATLERHGAPMDLDALWSALALRSDSDRTAVVARLRAMERDGQVIRNRREQYCLVGRIPVVTGRVIGHRDGYGFLVPDQGGDDVYLSPRQMRELMHGDRAAVRVEALDRRGRAEGVLVEVLERSDAPVAGRYRTEGGLGFVVPDNVRIAHRLIIPPGKSGGAVDGELVVATITDPPTAFAEPLGVVTERLGAPDAPGVETEMAIRSHELPHRWPEDVEKEAAEFSERVSSAHKRGRLDLRDLPLVTIDGADARDFDDAVYCERVRGGWRLIVAIADVGHYVRPGTAIDREARARGTSVYFARRVLPMLPEVLSNGLCSLNPQVDRLCLACEMKVGTDGEVRKAQFHEAVMRSAARLTYEEVARELASGPAPRKRTTSPQGRLHEHLHELHDLYRAFAAARARRGAVDVDLPEVRVTFGADGRVEGLARRSRNDAHRLIEECMIAANVQAASFLRRHRMPALFRRHDPPAPDRIAALREFLGTLGIKLGGVHGIEPRHLRAVVEQVADRPERTLVETLVLRSMALAVYDATSPGHFGLALAEYAHFTSPIRRYPDLIVHRAIRHVLRGGKPSTFEPGAKEMHALGVHCSETERRADEATREALDWLKCEYMQERIGEVLSGVVSGVADFGLFVQLDDVPVDGLLHVSGLGSDYFRHERERHSLVGSRSGVIFRLGDRVRVRVARVDLEARRIDFELAEAPRPGRRRQRGRR